MGRVTITTDASYCPETGVGAFAFWISSDAGPVLKSGILKAPLNGSISAEAAAIANAVCFLSRTAKRLRRVIINTDCLSVKNFLMEEATIKKQNETVKRAVKYVHSKCIELGWTLDVRHVKAHSGVATSRKYVNSWCDGEAKRVLREYRKSKKI